jgi:hypothetical protein
MSTKNLKCSCPHFYQDAMCGAGLRIHVSAPDSRWRCMVCGALKDEQGKPASPAAPSPAPDAPAPAIA